MKRAEINKKYKGGFSLFEGYETVELIPEPKNNQDNLLWLWCYDADMMPLNFARINKDYQKKIILELLNRNSLKSVLITVVIDGFVVAKNGRPVKMHKYEEEHE